MKHSKEILCTSCHKPQEKRKFVHKPFAESACLDCHDPHGGNTKAFLKEESVGKLCEQCHQPAQSKFLHKPVATGECLLCHAAHQSDHEKLVLSPGKDLCITCHAQVRDLLMTAPYTHGPANVDCGICHFSHGGENPALLRKDQKSLCIDCHDAVAEKIAKDAHVHGALAAEKGCSGCHTPHASEYQSQLIAVAGELCLTCHNKEITNPATRKKVANVGREIAAGKFKHGPVRTGDCQGCHFPHSSNCSNLLHENYPAEFYKEFSEANFSLCFGCHEKGLALEQRTATLTNFRDGDHNLHFLHVNRAKGRTCRACHEIHASNFPSHIRKSIPFGASGWMLPINFEKTETGGKCSPGCHKPKAYDHPGPAVPAVPAAPAASNSGKPGKP